MGGKKLLVSLPLRANAWSCPGPIDTCELVNVPVAFGYIKE